MAHPRFRFQSSAENPAERCGQPLCRCCAAVRRARAASLWDSSPELQSPLTPGIATGNISATEDGGSLRIDLWPEWRPMLAGLRRVGSVLWMSRSPAAAIAKWSVYPEMHWPDGQAQARDESGELDLDFRPAGPARAKHERRPTGHLFSAEFHDAAGFCFHRVCLTADSSLDAFADWTRAHQAIVPADDAPPVAPSEAPAAALGLPSDWLLSEPGAVGLLLDACVERELALHAIVSSPCAMQGHRFQPVKRTESEGSVCFHSADVALHFEPEKFGAVRVHQLDLGGAECRALKAYDGEGALSLTLLPASSERLPLWNLLVRAVA